MDDDIRALADRVKVWRDDPVAFAREALGATVTDQQAAVLRDFARPGSSVASKSGHGTGKSSLMAMAVLWMLTCFAGATIGCTAPSAHQLHDVLWRELRKWHARLPEPIRESIRITADGRAVLDYGNGVVSAAYARTSRADQPDAMQGLHGNPMAFLFDEASGVPEAVYEAAAGALTTAGSRVLLCGNPVRPSGYFYKAFGAGARWVRHTLSSAASPLVDPAYVEEMRREYGEDSDIFRVRVLGEFPSASDLQFIPTDLVSAARKRIILTDAIKGFPVILGVDVALHGSDRKVIVRRQGLQASILWSTRDPIDTQTMAGMIAQHWDSERADAVAVDETGLGVGVVHTLQGWGRTPLGINFGSVSTRKDCHNKRTEMWADMRDWLKDGAIPDDDDLQADLTGAQYQYDTHGRFQLERKQDMKRRGIESPDVGDALALTFAPKLSPTKIYEPHDADSRKSTFCGMIMSDLDECILHTF